MEVDQKVQEIKEDITNEVTCSDVGMRVSNLFNHISEDIAAEVMIDEDLVIFVLGPHEESVDVAVESIHISTTTIPCVVKYGKQKNIKYYFRNRKAKPTANHGQWFQF